jgi:HSP20 family protein
MTLMRREPRLADLPTLFARPMLSWADWLGEPLEKLLESGGIAVEEFDEDGAHIVRAELPGIDPERDVEVTLADGMLHIRAERRREEKVEHEHYYREEIRYGSFSRLVPLPEGCAEEDVTADYTDGILTVRVPLAPEKGEATKVPVTRG